MLSVYFYLLNIKFCVLIQRINRTWYVFIFKCGHVATALNMVSKDEWFTFIPEACAKSDLHPEGVVFFTVDKPALAWSFVAAYKKKTPFHVLREFLLTR